LSFAKVDSAGLMQRRVFFAILLAAFLTAFFFFQRMK
jgi:hypothetical protein